MNKLKGFIAALLSVGVMVSATALTACSGNGDNGDSSVTLTAGEQVANEVGWKKAFDNVFNTDSFTAKYIAEDNLMNITSKGNMYADIKSGKCLMETIYEMHSVKMVDEAVDFTPIESQAIYFEVRETSAWECVSENNSTWKTRICRTGTDFNNTKDQMFLKDIFYDEGSPVIWLKEAFATTENGIDEGDVQSIGDLFSMFTYSEGYYISENLYWIGCTAAITVSISNGMVTGMKCVFSADIDFDGISEVGRTITITITNVNSTTVKAPAGATEAIDAAEAEAKKTN